MSNSRRIEESDEMKLRILGVFGLILLGCIGSRCVASLALQWKTIALAWEREEQSSCQAEEQPEPAHQRRWRRCKVKGTSSTRRFRGRPRVKRPYTQMQAGSVVETDEQAAEAEALEAGGAEAKEASHETEDTSNQVLVAGKSGSHLPFYRPDIDGLRAVAVISVILFHLQPSLLPGGFVGVDIFFVISGYVVSGSLLREQHSSSGSYLVAFYARRIKRLFPALLATCLGTSFLMGFIPEWTAALADYYTTGMLALIGWANQHFAFMPTGYFDDGPEGLQYNPFTHNWSLGVEEQFYLLYPCIVLYAFRSRVLIGCNSKPCISPLLLLGVSFLLSFGISLWMSREWQLAAYYLLPSRFWQLMAGSLLFVIHDSRWGVDLSLVASLVLEGAAVFLLSFSIIFTPGDHGFPLPWSVPAICGALATIASGATRTQRVCGVQLPLLRTALSHPTMVFIGKLSYPLYLAHWPIVVACRWTEGVDNLLQRVAVAAFTVVAACILYFCVEAPFRRWRPKRKWHVFAVFGVLLLGMELWLWLCKGPLYGRVQRLVQSSMQGSADDELLIELYPPSPLSPLPPLMPPPYLPPPPTSPTLSPPPAPPPKPPDPPSLPHLLPSPSPPVLSPMPSSLPHSPSNPASPPPISPSSCSAASRTGKSVYDSLHPAYSSLDAMHALSQYSTFTKRGCRCKLSPSAAIKHVPLEAVRNDATSAHLPQCFVPARPDQLPMLRGVQAFFDEQPCLLRLQQFSHLSDKNRRTAAAERVLQCLSPVRTGTLPRRAIFGIGDSHMAQLARSLMTAFDGAASVVWAASAFMCGFVSEDFIDTLLKGHFSHSKPEALDTCRIFNQKVDEALETLLQPCDIVVLHQRSWSQGSDHDLDGKLVFENDGGDSPQGPRATMFERIRQLQQLVNSRGATLVLIGDVAHLPEKAPFCASSLSAATRCETSHAAVLGQVAVEQGLYTSLARQHGTYYMPIHELFCTSSGHEIRCGALVPGTATLGYLDDNHLGTAGTAYLWPHICDFFNKHGLLGTS